MLIKEKNMSKLQKAREMLLDWKEARCRLERAKPNASKSDKRKYERKITYIDGSILPEIREVIRKLSNGGKANLPITSVSYWIVNLPKCSRELNKFGSSSLSKLKESTKEDVKLKRPQDLTEAELKELMKARDKSGPSDQQAMMDREQEWFEHYYGTDPVQFDETGKMVQPRPVRDVPKRSEAIKTKDGKDLEGAIDEIIHGLAEDIHQSTCQVHFQFL